ncbi:MAG: GLPGLI family protein [Bacteroidetes bacterium CHB5]|nr:GLPGLI family protein [Bacteroidetes bacterium CHB5]
MKKIILLLGILVSVMAAHIVLGQTGAILYEQKINMHRNIPAEREGMKAMVPEFRTTKQQLFFNDSESLYKTVIEDEEEQFSTGSGGMRMTFRMPSTELYMQTAGKIVSRQEFMGKYYLIEDSVQMSPWKFGDQVKTIAGYECRMAYYTRTDTIPTMVVMGPGGPPPSERREPRVRTTEITAWYTDKIRPFLGPERYNTLPGAVLAIDINNGERVIVAKTIELRELKKNELKKPTSGTKVTQAEFRKVMEEQMKQMGGRGMTIRN